MKKKLITIALVVVMAFSLAACGSKLEGTAAACATTIVNTTDNYLDGKVSAQSAYDTIHEAYDKMETDDANTKTAAMEIWLELGKMTRDGSGSKSDMIKYRNQLAKACGEEKRSS